MMKTDLHITFLGNCREAFAYYAKTFNSKIEFTMTYGEAPPEMNVEEEAKDMVMHMSMNLGTILLMGSDAPPSRRGPIGGYDISLSTADEAEVRRIFAALTDGGQVVMPLMPTFWSPLFGMATDKFGIGWMVSMPGPQM